MFLEIVKIICVDWFSFVRIFSCLLCVLGERESSWNGWIFVICV